MTGGDSESRTLQGAPSRGPGWLLGSQPAQTEVAWVGPATL